MVCRRVFFVMLAALILMGCRHSSRNQGPFQKQPPPPPYTASIPGPPANKSALVMGDAPARGTTPTDDPRLVPPKPPEMSATAAVDVPQPPKPPVVDSQVVPASATMPAFTPPPTLPVPKLEPKPRTQTAPNTQNIEKLKALHKAAADKWASIDTFEAKLTRRESMNGKDAPTEEVLFQFRKEPFSVYMRYTGNVGKGREVLFVNGKFNDQMQILTCKDDWVAGLRVSKSPNDEQVKARSRNDIRDSGFGSKIAAFKSAIDKLEAGKVPPESIKPLGLVKRPEYPYELEGVAFTIRPDEDRHFPKGGKREVYFDPRPDSPSYGLPVVSMVFGVDGRELEYNSFDKFRLPANLTDADFNPDRFGKKR